MAMRRISTTTSFLTFSKFYSTIYTWLLVSKSTLTPEEFRCWKIENLRQYLTMRDLAKTGKKEELAMFFGM
jgi:hypothetical protein